MREKEYLGGCRFVYQSGEFRVNEDALRLAAFSAPTAEDRVCDLGTGNGILPLWWHAQPGPPRWVDAVELQPEAAALARAAVADNGLSDRVVVHEADWNALPSAVARGGYSLVTCNPPYFAAGAGRLPPSAARRISRHEPYAAMLTDVCRVAASLCAEGGRVCVCHRPERWPDLQKALREAGLSLCRLHYVRKEGKTPWLLLCEARKTEEKSMRSVILFDLDGTLTDPKEGITLSVQHALRTGGIEVEDAETLRSFIGPPLKEQFMAYAHWTEEQAKAAVGRYRERFGTVGWAENKVYDGIPALLQALKDHGKRLAIATSKPTVFSERIVRHFGLTPYFEVVCGSELDGHRTKKAEVIEEALRRMGCEDPSQVLMVGDREHDVRGAKACKLACVGVRYGYAQGDELERAGADYVVDTVAQLQQLLLTL